MSNQLQLKSRFQQARSAIFQRYRDKKIEPEDLLSLLTEATDEMFTQLENNYPLPLGSALIAVGGYGRKELYPYSDIDILILLSQSPDKEDTLLIENFVAALWDMGHPIGSSVRTIQECLFATENDITIETSLVDRRFIGGHEALFKQLDDALNDLIEPSNFFLDKRLELRQRHHRYSESPFSLEPNCKESPGGLRDLHFMHWIAKASGFGKEWSTLVDAQLMTANEAQELKKAEHEFCRLRIELHLLTGKAEDRLLFQYQPQLATIYNIQAQDNRQASEALMRRYYWAARIVFIFCNFMQQNFQDYFFPCNSPKVVIDKDFEHIDGRLHLRYPNAYAQNPQLILKTFVLMAENKNLRDIHVRTQRALWKASHLINEEFRLDPINQSNFLAILKAPRGIVHNLRRMTMLGILQRYIPEFHAIVGQMQHDLLHVYTVDQHTLMVIRNLRRFSMPEHAQEYPLASRLMSQFSQHWLLYLAALFHDIAKGRGGDHSELGAIDAQAFANSHHLNSHDAELLVFLVRYHLMMSNVAQKRDTSDPEVIAEFAHFIKDERHLTALCLLTIADIRGTNPTVWNDWKSHVFEICYENTLKFLGNEVNDSQSLLHQRKSEAQAQLRLTGLDDNQCQKVWSRFDAPYFMRHEVSDITWHTRILSQLDSINEHIVVKARPFKNNAGLQVFVYTHDKKKLFQIICGYFFSHKLNILDAKIHTTQDGYAIDSFMIESPDINDGARAFTSVIETGLSKHIMEAMLPQKNNQKTCAFSANHRRKKTFPIVPHINLYPDEKSMHWHLSISAMDMPGVLYAIACCFTQFDINLQMAKVMTLGGRLEDTFIIKGEILSNPRLQLDFKRALLDALTQVTQAI